ncbi:TatD family hydrolase [Aspergillus stella-maris]|uniref:TatD family hydrolase n=1 Tax=Aspergillus stella-maris TaxID=1810926 RepID=UPI003CCCDA4A
MSNDKPDDNGFPWGIGVFDAHCHPTDTMASMDDIPRMKATTLTVMSTRADDQDLVFQSAKKLADDPNSKKGDADRILPCFGWHPWFSHQLIDDTAANAKPESIGQEADNLSADDVKKAHYSRVLKPPPDDDFVATLPPPKPLSQLLSETRSRLEAFPHALVGEVGLDRAFRLPQPWTPEEKESRNGAMTPGSREGRKLSPHQVRPEHQKAVLEAQLRLAGEMQRPVSVHSVQGHGGVVEVFKSIWKGHEKKVASRRERKRRGSHAEAHTGSNAEDTNGANASGNEEKKPFPFPPRICMHSYSGPPEALSQFIHPSNPSTLYFSFSSVINFSHHSDRSVEVIKALPDDRVLVESDLHIAGNEMDDKLEEVTRQICEIRGWELNQGVQQLADNWKRFAFGEAGVDSLS